MKTATTIDTGIVLKPAEIRKSRGMRTRDVGQALRLSHVRISQIERHGTPLLDTIQAMADLYEVPFDYMRAANDLVRNS